jgi:hypothetical protein
MAELHDEHEAEAAIFPNALEEYQANLAKLGMSGAQVGNSHPIVSPARPVVFDWEDYPLVVAAYAASFPHNGPMDKRSTDWEAQTQPRSNPNTKRPSGPNEGVLLS